MTEPGTKLWPPQLKRMKQRGEKIAMLTAYDAVMARLLERAGIDVLLVGDSLGMVLLGYESTLPVTLEEMIHHTRAVSRGARQALVIADMPFLTYQVSIPEAIRNAGRLLKEGGANAVKIEGARIETARAMVEAGIPVMGHLGLLPQSVNQLGGFRQQAKSAPEAERLVRDAKALEEAGVFAIVLESIPAEAGRAVTEVLGIPTIGIGAGPHCDGQVLVSYDALGLSEGYIPSFAKMYADLSARIIEAARKYAGEVRSGSFAPEPGASAAKKA